MDKTPHPSVVRPVGPIGFRRCREADTDRFALSKAGLRAFQLFFVQTNKEI
jgi:hypothetical protein